MALPPNYSPQDFEANIYQRWQAEKVGNPEKQGETSGVYTDLMPPPNLTGDLHAGHAFGHYLMDTLARIHRQRGEKTLWIPGVDHAGIQLEGLIDKAIKAGEFDEEIKNIKDLPEKKEDLPKYLKKNHTDLWLQLAWKKANEWRDNQAKQSSVLGDTPDHSRNLFTLDEKAVETVNFAFKKYYEDGLIYKKSYLINWSVGLQTALSDVPEDIGYEKRKDPFITFEYRLNKFLSQTAYIGKNGVNDISVVDKLLEYFNESPLLVSTVRPETIFADKAIAIHPKKLTKLLSENNFLQDEIDTLFKLFEAKNLEVYFKIEGMIDELPLILADEVDPDFGTGALKITPAHDLVDYNIFHKYIGGEFEQAVGRDGRLTEICGEFAAMTVLEGRKAVIDKLIEIGYVPKKRDEKGVETEEYEVDWNYEHNVTICERSKTIVEPLISEEFFLSYTNKDAAGKSLQEYGLEGVSETKYYPDSFGKLATDYLHNIKDWCISRDLVWGHKMPVWYNLDRNPERKFYTKAEVLANPELGRDFQIDAGGMPEKYGNWVQEEKILDTWFSSCLWPLSTLDFAGHTQGKVTDFDTYYPTQDMITAREIFYAWIVRMTVLGKYFTGKIPFQNLIITPTIQTEQGTKMSKSLKNGLDPLESIEKYSSDSLRMAMLGGMIPNRNMRLGGALADRLMEKYRNFGNKVWNIARFLESKNAQKTQLAELSPASVWIKEKFVTLQSDLEKNMEIYELTHSINAIYTFLWDDFADWYVEYLKTDDSQLAFAYKLFRQFIITLSPYLPFETQAIWQEYFGQKNLLAFEKLDTNWHTKFPSTLSSDEFIKVVEFIQEIRSVKGLYAIDPVQYIEVTIQDKEYIKYAEFVRFTARANLSLDSGVKSEFTDSRFGYSINILDYIKDRELELNRTNKLISSLEKQISQLESQLANQKFIDHAEPEAVVQKKQDLKDRQDELSSQQSKLKIL